eukprot:114155-Amphidinium_carterae.1
MKQNDKYKKLWEFGVSSFLYNSFWSAVTFMTLHVFDGPTVLHVSAVLCRLHRGNGLRHHNISERHQEAQHHLCTGEAIGRCHLISKTTMATAETLIYH